MKTKYIQVQFTIDDKALAIQIAERLVDEKLAACVQILTPITSIFRWQGKREKSREVLCLLKTSQVKYKTLEKRINELHPYDVPEIIALDIIDIDSDYAAWIDASIM